MLKGEGQESIQRALPALFLAWLALSVIAPHPDLFKAWFHLVLALPAAVWLTRHRHLIDTRDPLFRLSMGLFLYTGLSSLVISDADWVGHAHALRWSLEAALLVLILFQVLPTLLTRPLFLGRFLIVCTLLGSTASLVMFAFGISNDPTGRLSGPGALSNPVQAASVLLTYLAMGIFLLWTERSQLARRDWLLVSAALVLAFLAVLLSESRAAIFIFSLAVLYCLLVAILTYRAWKALIIAISCLGIAVSGIVLLYGGVDGFIEAMLARGASYRPALWSALLENPPDSLLFGHGSATNLTNTAAGLQVFQETGYRDFHAHNLFIGTFARTGLIGLTVLLALLGLILHGILRATATPMARMHLLGLYAMVLMLCLTDTYTLVISVKAVWLFTWLPLIMAWLRVRHGTRGT
ncbi:MAG: O-antigen ligase family protein [Pseudohongiellaceae bacterium]